MTSKLDSTTQDILVECARSTRRCAEVLFPSRYTRPFERQHDQVFELLDADPKKYPRKLILAHRGFGKSSLVQLALASRHILFNLSRYIVQVSCTNGSAVTFSNDLRAELLSNPIIQSIWGNIQSEDDFTKEFWVAQVAEGMNTAYRPRGVGQQIRGANYRGNRPDLLLIDDLEDPDTIDNPDVRSKVSSWFYKDALGTFDFTNMGHVIVVGTPLHQDCLIYNLEETKDWEVIRIPLCDDGYNVLYDSVPQSVVDNKLSEYRNAGKLSGFAQEYLLQVISTEDAPFRQEYFQYYDEADLQANGHHETIIIVDAAKTAKKGSDDSAIIAFAIDPTNNKFFLRDVIAEKLHPSEVIGRSIDMAIAMGAKVLAVEETGLNEWIIYSYKDELIRRKVNDIELLPLKAIGKKEDRIRQLEPFYRKGLIFHNKPISAKLEAQLISFPKSKHDDVSDALAHGLKVFETGNRYLSGDTMLDSDLADESAYFSALENGDYEANINDRLAI